jgi:hypothetical protein
MAGRDDAEREDNCLPWFRLVRSGVTQNHFRPRMAIFLDFLRVAQHFTIDQSAFTKRSPRAISQRCDSYRLSRAINGGLNEENDTFQETDA